MRSTLRLLLLVSAVTLALPATAATYSLVDGSSLGAEVQGVHGWIGVPAAGVRYMAGQPEDFDFGYGLTVFYLQPALEPSFSFRWSLHQDEEFNFALKGDAGFHWNMGVIDPRHSPGNVGLRLNPGITVGMHPHPKYSTYFTLEAPLLWTWQYGGGLQLPVLMGMGAEYAMSPDVNFIFFGDVGPQFELGGGYVGGVRFRLDLWIGLSFRLF